MTSARRSLSGVAMTRLAYSGANALMFAAWLGVALFMFVYTGPSNIDRPLIATFVVAVTWNIVSYGRAKVTRLQWLHFAPYLAIGGGYLVVWGLIEGANNGPWVIGYKPSPAWHLPLQLLGLLLLLAWPLATVTLIFRKSPK